MNVQEQAQEIASTYLPNPEQAKNSLELQSKIVGLVAAADEKGLTAAHEEELKAKQTEIDELTADHQTAVADLAKDHEEALKSKDKNHAELVAVKDEQIKKLKTDLAAAKKK